MLETLVRDQAAQREDDGAPGMTGAQLAHLAVPNGMRRFADADRDGDGLVAESFQRGGLRQQLGRGHADPVGAPQQPALEPPVQGIEQALPHDIVVPVYDYLAVEAAE